MSEPGTAPAAPAPAPAAAPALDADALERLGLRFDPFAADARVPFFSGGDRGKQLEQLAHFTQWARSVIIVTGEADIGKTSMCTALAEQVPEGTRLALLTGGILTSARELLLRIGHGFGMTLADSDDTDALIEALVAQAAAAEEATGHGCVVLLDDAHELGRDGLLALAQLALRALEVRALNVVLFAEPSFVGVLRRMAQDMQPALVWHEIRVNPLSPADTRAYVEHRLASAGFDADTPLSAALTDDIQRRSYGLPGRINRLAAAALARASYGGRALGVGLPRAHLAVIAVLVGVFGGLGLFYREEWFGSDPAPADMDADRGGAPAAGQAGPTPEELLLLREPDFGDTASTDMPAEVAAPVDGPAVQGTPGDRDARSENPTPAAPVAAVVAEPAPEPAPAPAPRVRNTPEDAGVAWLRAQPPDAWTVQVAGVSSRAALERFLAAQPVEAPFVGYGTRRGNSDWFVLLYGSFDSRAEAGAAARNLPASAGKVQPWVRRFGDLQASLE